MAPRNNNPSKAWLYMAAVLSVLIVVLNLYYALSTQLSQQEQVSCLQPPAIVDNNNNNNLSPPSNILFGRVNKTTSNKKRTVVVFTCNEEYGMAVASSVISVRIDGGYSGDVAVLMEESHNFTLSSMKEAIIQQQKEQNAIRNTNSTTTTTIKNDNPLHRVFIFSTEELWDSLIFWSTKEQEANTSSIANLRNTPPAGWCLPPKRMRGHRGYFLKTLIYHPIMAERWDTVLFLDACMTIHSPHIDEIFAMPEVKGSVLALPDPWRWAQDMLWGRLLSCTKQALLEDLAEFLGRDLKEALYFTTGLVLYDTDVIRNYQPIEGNPSTSSTSSSSTENYSASLIELLQVYHKYSSLFPGDQPLVSIYWYHVRDQMRNLPLTMLGTNRVPYEFIKRLKSPHIFTVGNSQRPTCLARPKHGLGGDGRNDINNQ